MTSALFAEQREAIRAIFARVTASDPGVFSSNVIHVSVRPEPAPWPFTALIVGFDAALVVCVEERYHGWALENVVGATPQRANYIAFPLVAEAARMGHDLHAAPPMLGWALSHQPDLRTPPDVVRLDRVDKRWMDQWQPRGIFPNALGLPVQMHRTFRNQFGYAIFDAAGEPAAVAGVFDTAGLSEIGVDVTPQHRGRGLSSLVATAACRELIDARSTPFYVCEVRNIRSQHTALASGFLSVCSLSIVMQAGIGLA